MSPKELWRVETRRKFLKDEVTQVSFYTSEEAAEFFADEVRRVGDTVIRIDKYVKEQK